MSDVFTSETEIVARPTNCDDNLILGLVVVALSEAMRRLVEEESVSILQPDCLEAGQVLPVNTIFLGLTEHQRGLSIRTAAQHAIKSLGIEATALVDTKETRRKDGFCAVLVSAMHSDTKCVSQSLSANWPILAHLSIGEKEIRYIIQRQLGKQASRNLDLSVDACASVIRSALTDNTQRVRCIDLVPQNERSRLLREVAGVSSHLNYNTSIVRQIEKQIQITPESIAYTYDNQDLTYRQANAFANRVANDLEIRGVEKGDLIPVAMHNGFEMPISYLAIMKIGAGFVPIDPSWPAERVKESLSALEPKLVIVTHETSSRVPEVWPTYKWSINSVAPLEAYSSHHIEPTDVIYGFFTSGSTGNPSCALNYHRGISNRFLYMTKVFGPNPGSVVLQNSTQVFDPSVWQLFWPLTFGGRVIIPENNGMLDLRGAIDLIYKYSVTMTDFVPTVLANSGDSIPISHGLDPLPSVCAPASLQALDEALGAQGAAGAAVLADLPHLVLQGQRFALKLPGISCRI